MALPVSSAAAIAAAENSGLVDGMPFILGDDGSYDHDLNRFFRACPTMGVRSLNSLRAYARDISCGSAFWRSGGRQSVWAADRRMSQPTMRPAVRRCRPRISAASNRCVAALDKLYRWAVEEKLIAKAPFTYRQMWVAGRMGAPSALQRISPASRLRGTVIPVARSLPSVQGCGAAPAS
jgi:hypothetical protein